MKKRYNIGFLFQILLISVLCGGIWSDHSQQDLNDQLYEAFENNDKLVRHRLIDQGAES